MKFSPFFGIEMKTIFFFIHRKYCCGCQTVYFADIDKVGSWNGEQENADYVCVCVLQPFSFFNWVFLWKFQIHIFNWALKETSKSFANISDDQGLTRFKQTMKTKIPLLLLCKVFTVFLKICFLFYWRISVPLKIRNAR